MVHIGGRIHPDKHDTINHLLTSFRTARERFGQDSDEIDESSSSDKVTTLYRVRTAGGPTHPSERSPDHRDRQLP